MEKVGTQSGLCILSRAWDLGSLELWTSPLLGHRGSLPVWLFSPPTLCVIDAQRKEEETPPRLKPSASHEEDATSTKCAKWGTRQIWFFFADINAFQICINMWYGSASSCPTWSRPHLSSGSHAKRRDPDHAMCFQVLGILVHWYIILDISWYTLCLGIRYTVAVNKKS